MRHITKIHLHNFQSHKDTVIELAGPGEITAICGPSDVGKSAIIRALDWVFNNSWQNDFMRHGAKSCAVSVYYNDGHIVEIKRPRSGSTHYDLTFPGGTVQRFEGIGRNVPEEIKMVTGVRPVDFGDFSFVVNLAKQAAGPFLGSSVSGPQRARIVGSLSGCDEVDLAARMLSNQIIKDRQEERALTEDISGLDLKIGEYDYLEDLQKTTEGIGALLERIRKEIADKENLTSLWHGLAKNSGALIGETLHIKNLSGFIDSAAPLAAKTEKDILAHDNLSARFSSLREILGEIQEQDEILDATRLLPWMFQIQNHTEEKNSILKSLTRINGLYQTVSNGLKKEAQAISLSENVDEALALLGGLCVDSEALLRLRNAFCNKETLKSQLEESELTLALTKNIKEGMKVNSQALADDVLFGKLEQLLGEQVRLDFGIDKMDWVLGITENIKGVETEMFESERGLNLLAAYFGLDARRARLEKAMSEVADEITRTEHVAKLSEESYIAKLKEMGICEVCGAEVTDENIERVI